MAQDRLHSLQHDDSYANYDKIIIKRLRTRRKNDTQASQDAAMLILL
jgi:hypothetical protein